MRGFERAQQIRNGLNRNDSSSFGGSALLFLLITAFLFTGAGCAALSSSDSFSESSGSVSDSVGSFSDSSGSSSDSSSGDDSAYRDEIRRYTVAAAESGASPDSLRRGVSEIALGYGVSDWEALDATWAAISAGIAASNIAPEAATIYRTALAPPER